MTYTCKSGQKILADMRLMLDLYQKTLAEYEITGDQMLEYRLLARWVSLERSLKHMQIEMTSTPEADAYEIMGDEHFIGTEVAEKVFEGAGSAKRIPFSRTELLEAKQKDKILMYRPAKFIDAGQMHLYSMVTNLDNREIEIEVMNHFSGDHEFDVGVICSMLLEHPLAEMAMVKPSWNLLELHTEEATLEAASAVGSLPSVIEVVYDVMASKKVGEFFRKTKTWKHVWTSTKTDHPNETFAVYRAIVDNRFRLNPVILVNGTSLPFYTSEKREVE